MILLNPKKHNKKYPDAKSKEIMLKTIDFFESKGLKKVKDDDQAMVWYRDFVEFQKKEEIFATMLTPSEYGSNEDCRWDTYRNCEFNEILGFYGLAYWYTWQVSILGLGPLWMSKNEEVKRRTAKLLKEGHIFAFGLSEKEHGADVYSSELTVTPMPDGKYRANGEKYYIGNANEAGIVSTFGKIAGSGEYVFIAADPTHKNYELVRSVVASQNYVAQYKLNDYPLTEADIISKGQDAWDAALNTVNIGKYNLGWASIGIATHAFYEAIHHAGHRNLYGKYVTDFPHIKQLFVDAYTRLAAMKLFAMRTSDYMRTASKEDRRYLLYSPIVKNKVTTQGEQVILHLWDVIAAKGFEKDMYFAMAARDIQGLPRLEGTVHVNVALIVKFMANYFFNPKSYPDIDLQMGARDDDFLFDQGPTKGLGKIQFHDYNIAYNSIELPNLSVFKEQIAVFKEALVAASPGKEQQTDIDFLLTIGEMFTLVAYGQLIIENAKIYGIDNDLLDQIFDFFVRDFSVYATQLHGKQSSTDKQQEYCKKMIRKPVVDKRRYDAVWEKYVYSQKDAYTMNE